ncbi:hypothetical protein BN971_04648 [Mycobacterium bohemicum DSM 44277]|uniref:Uncharacterized protein n=2 Tax=Mycobacterium bohemicum TaxID=56425 RepID=A0A1X1R110_MYCBE|nr:hypothetical protein [Mycobacterium bohemicum]MCV6970253.1 hypothetical protein [Mycobacterium bohemicum]ORU97710.1 hypothetical protein AWB93_17225 [Mycobacterium bohemicum]CPR13338.1 hypothetical protein BN971_04648 [Mycobacterium bohemicum DSM 44277]
MVPEDPGTAGGARRVRRVVAACAIAAAACSAPETPSNGLESSPEVQLWRVGALLHEPVWSYHSHALVALTDDHRLAEVAAASPGEAATRLSAPMPVGRNVQISQKDDRDVYVPQPERDKVAVVELQTLRQVGEFDAGPAPAYLSQDAGLRVLLALSADGTSVTPVDEYGSRELPAAPITGLPATSIDGANRGREIDYHLYASSGIRHYQGRTSPPRERGSLGLDVAVSAGDGTAVSRSYVAGRDSDVLYAADSRRGGDGMEVLATARLGSAIRELATDDFRIYAATDREVAVLETDSFTGFPQRQIPVIRTIDYRAGLPPDAQAARLSGMAVGPHRVYLTFAEAPYVVSVAKPRV